MAQQYNEDIISQNSPVDKMEIEIIKDDDPYTRVLNALIFDENLRLQTRMVLIMMTSVRQDWDFSIRGMAKIAHVTKDTMSKMLAEMEAAGYVKRKKQPRGSTGRFAKAGYLVSRKPIFVPETEHKNQDTEEPCPTLPYTVSPYTKNSPQLNTKQSTTKQSSSPYSPPAGDSAPAETAPEDKTGPKPKRPRREKSAPVHDPDAFETFWAAYPRKDDRKVAVSAWDKLRPDRALCREMYAALKRQRRSDQWNREEGRFIPLFSTWLNGRKWENRGVDPALLDKPRPADPGGWADDPEGSQ